VLVKPKVSEKFSGLQPFPSKIWLHSVLYDNNIDNNLDASFLNYTKKLNLPSDWNAELPSKLWVYNLHYFQDLLSENAHDKTQLHLKLLNRWIDENPAGFGNGWEPYPISLRIVNVLKAWLGGLKLDRKLFSSIFEQASYLSNDLEKHLLGNHYFSNLKALLFTGVIFENTRWSEVAEKGLLTEIPEQILEDGANFELSPMYHSLILIDMLDMLNLKKAYPTRISNELTSLIEEYIPKMLVFMEAMAHPDDGLSFFNDSVNGIAPPKARIKKYAEKLGFDINSYDPSKTQIIDNAQSGYMCATTAGNKLIFDASSVGPDYIPGHAHADTLSFELSLGTQRVLVNSGISEYGSSTKRISQRKTSSHNTVEVDGKDSSTVWSSFRVANRARILSRLSKLKSDNNIILQADHNGYKSLFGGCIHSRKLIFNQDCLVISDSLKGSFKFAISRFHFHPDLKISLENNLLRVEGPKFVFQSDLIGHVVSLVDSYWHPEFGLEIPNKVLEIQFQNNKLEVIFDWTNN